MKDVYEVLRSKEREMETLAVEIEALRVVAPLLSDDGDSGNDSTPVAATRWTAPPRSIRVPRGANTDPQPDHAPEWKTRTAGFQ
jgi:hypothetical protein